MTPVDLARRRLRRAVRGMSENLAERNEAIIDLRAAGLSLSQIAADAGLSKEGVAVVLRSQGPVVRERKRSRPPKAAPAVK